MKVFAVFVLLIISACASSSGRFEPFRASFADPLPIEMNPSVEREIADYLKSSVTRAQLREAFSRMNEQKSKLSSVLAKAGVPENLLSFAIVQSGFQNHIPKNNADNAGIWAFTPFTANLYGLVSDDEPGHHPSVATDDRLDFVKETAAAGEYLLHLRKRFGDWRLALIAYCRGDGSIEVEMEKNEKMDPWQIEKTSGQSFPCLAKTMAVLYLQAHPDLIKP